jgi:uncharacterized protein (TIGR03067 family)
MHTALLLGLAFTVSAPALKDKTPKEETTILGEWNVVDSIAGGKSDGLMQRAPIDKIVITTETWTVHRMGQGGPGSPIRFDPKAKPAQLDIGTNNNPHCKSIYKIEGDTLTVCYVMGGERPEKFESPVNSNVRIMILKRIKPEKP